MNTQPKDLRYFLGLLDRKYPGELLRVDTEGKDFDLSDCDAAAFLAKLKASDVAMRVTTDAVQLIGGYGYMRRASRHRG